MPLYCGQPFVTEPVPEGIRPDELIFYHKLTGEIFTNYDDYFERTIQCSLLVWTCSATGKSQLTFQEALESELQARVLTNTFQHDAQKAPIMYLMRYILFTSARDICDIIYVFAGNRYFSGEIVDVIVSNIKFRARITRVLSPSEHERGVIGGSSSLEGAGEHRRLSCQDEVASRNNNINGNNNNNNNIIQQNAPLGFGNTILEETASVTHGSSGVSAMMSVGGDSSNGQSFCFRHSNRQLAPHQYKYEIEPLGDKKLELVRYLKSHQAAMDVIPSTRAGSVKVSSTSSKQKIDPRQTHRFTHVVVDAYYVTRPAGSLLQIPVRYFMRRRLHQYQHHSVLGSLSMTQSLDGGLKRAPYQSFGSSVTPSMTKTSPHARIPLTNHSRSIDDPRGSSAASQEFGSSRISGILNFTRTRYSGHEPKILKTSRMSIAPVDTENLNNVTFGQLVNLITRVEDLDELPMAVELANVVSSARMDELARVLVTSFDARRLLTPLLSSMFNKEVEVADCMQTLFRGNSLATRVMSYCFKIFGSAYLKRLLEPHIRPLVVNSSSTGGSEQDSCEIDPSRLEPGGDIERNRKNLLALTKRVFDSILASAPRFPPQLKLMCHCLYQVLHERYNPPHATARNSLVAIGTVIFLRFINPAIVSPCEAGIIERQPDIRVKRKLMLMSKILQNIANNVEFRKEEHMIPFNDFVRQHFESARHLVSEIAMVEGGTRRSGSTSSSSSSSPLSKMPPDSISFIGTATVGALYRLLGPHSTNTTANNNQDQRHHYSKNLCLVL